MRSLRQTTAFVVAFIVVSMGVRAASAQQAPPDDTPRVTVGGTIFTSYTYTDEPKVKDSDGNSIAPNAFEVTRAYLNLTGNLSHLVSFRITPDVSGRLGTSVGSQSTVTGGAPGETVTTTTTGSTSYDGSLVFRLKYAFGQLNL